MQVTYVSAYSLRQLLCLRCKGINASGLTVRPGTGNGLFLTGLNREDFGRTQGYVGFLTGFNR